METQSKDKVYVIGHKNPDTDSICSSICYAYLKRQITGDDYVPMRAGEINAETKYVLNAFSAAVPEYMENVSTQVKDVEYRHIDGVDGEISIKNAWEILSESGATTLPSVNENGNLVGLITVRDIAMTYMEVYDNRVIASAHTPYKNIINTLSADLIVGDEKDYVHTGKVLISAANPDMMENYIERATLSSLVTVTSHSFAQLRWMHSASSSVTVRSYRKQSRSSLRITTARSSVPHMILIPQRV
jgi:manganese-dependent inorganic pyrophosphatase